MLRDLEEVFWGVVCENIGLVVACLLELEMVVRGGSGSRDLSAAVFRLEREYRASHQAGMGICILHCLRVKQAYWAIYSCEAVTQ